MIEQRSVLSKYLIYSINFRLANIIHSQSDISWLKLRKEEKKLDIDRIEVIILNPPL